MSFQNRVGLLGGLALELLASAMQVTGRIRLRRSAFCAAA
jgi:hypothetical protein